MSHKLPAACYGVNWLGEDIWLALLGEGRPSWPTVRVRQVKTSEPLPGPRAGEGEHVVGLLSGGYLRLRRDPREATYFVPELLGGEELVHPYLAPAAYAFATWSGREAYHAGAFEVAGGAWALVAEREGGKSSTLAWLAQRGYPVVCDDLLVVEDHTLLPGPRCIDLREGAATHLGVGAPLKSVRAGGRWRVMLESIDPVPLRGWLFLRWGKSVEVRPLGPRERLSLLVALGRPTDPQAPLSLAGVPAWEVVRPRLWESLPEASDRLLEAAVSG